MIIGQLFWAFNPTYFIFPFWGEENLFQSINQEFKSINRLENKTKISSSSKKSKKSRFSLLLIADKN